MVVFIWVSAWSGCTFPIAIGCATLELAHLGQSVVVSARAAPFVVLRVRSLVPSMILSCWGAPCRHCRVVLRHLRPVRWRYVGWVDLVRRLLSRYTPCPLHIDGLHSIVKPWVEHLSRFFWAVAPWLVLVHFIDFDCYGLIRCSCFGCRLVIGSSFLMMWKFDKAVVLAFKWLSKYTLRCFRKCFDLSVLRLCLFSEIACCELLSFWFREILDWTCFNVKLRLIRYLIQTRLLLIAVNQLSLLSKTTMFDYE